MSEKALALTPGGKDYTQHVSGGTLLHRERERERRALGVAGRSEGSGKDWTYKAALEDFAVRDDAFWHGNNA